MSNAGKQIHYQSCMMGSDPELFFERGGQIIGAERVIHEGHLDSTAMPEDEMGRLFPKPKAFVLDGVQIELNPRPHTCRGHMALELRTSFRALRRHLEGMKDIKATFRSVVELDPKELDSLSDKAKILGCAPSKNLYDSVASISIDPTTYTKRSAGGHIHIGLTSDELNLNALMPYREEALVPLMDCLVGLPSVFVDRDPLAAERRKVYGRAGEYRLPDHGLEYRTLSNFWLRSYQLMSMVFGLTRLAVSVAAMTHVSKSWDATSELLGNVDLELVKTAINGSDIKLAKKAWVPVSEFIYEHVYGGGAYANTGLCRTLLEPFGYFVQKIEEKGIEYWFPQDPIEHWCNMPDNYRGNGWEGFLTNRVIPEAAGRVSDFKTVYDGSKYENI